MSNQRIRSLRVLARVLAVTSGLIAVVIFALYGLHPAALSDTGVSLTAALLGTVGAVYYFTLFPVLSRERLELSTLILTAITTLNLVLVICVTGGLDSPYYSLWLLVIVMAGLFGSREIMLVLAITVVYYLYEFAANGFHSEYIASHLVQLGITLIAGGLAEWVYSRGHRSVASGRPAGALSGKLTAEQLKAEAIMSSIADGVMVIDADRKIQLFNSAAQTLTGWDETSAQNIDYTPVLQLKTVDDQPLTELNDPFLEAWRKQTTVIRDNLILMSRSGRKVQISLSVSPIYDNNGDPSGAIALLRDISKEKEVDRQKDEFISTASHEMRTPVAAIEGYISLAMNPNVATIDDRAKKYLEQAHSTITHLGELFRDLLGVTKAEEGVLGGRIEAVNLGQLLQNTINDMQFTADKKKLTLVFQIGDTGGPAIAPLYHVAANPERLREVVTNLIDNALKFTHEGGVKVTLEGNDKETTVSISDSGLGIAPEDIKHLFQKFYRIDSSATRTIGGTGLGLYLCRRVIELFNGRIWVDSKPGQGSTFRFTLPRLSEADIERLQTRTGISTGTVMPAPPPAAVAEPIPGPSLTAQPAPPVPVAPVAPEPSTVVMPNAGPPTG